MSGPIIRIPLLRGGVVLMCDGCLQPIWEGEDVYKFNHAELPTPVICHHACWREAAHRYFEGEAFSEIAYHVWWHQQQPMRRQARWN